ncbi:MAG: M23 family metallopeptidase [Bacteroidota bacterium]|nr:M23 family metallopeptidase [Bacteroidota bacterium]MDP4227461.1 M23 family metallopeptidase [Bacteroidota bacterium]
MSKIRYRFNPELLVFDKVKTSFRQKFIKGFTFFTASLVVSIIYYLLFSAFFHSPKEKALIREKNQLLFQYKIMNKKLDQVSKVLKDLEDRDDNIYRTIFEADPIPESVREAGFGGVNRYSELEGYSNSKLIIETTKKLDILTKEAYIQSKSYDQVIALARNKQKMLASIPAIQPIPLKNLVRPASGFGWRIHPIYKIKEFHPGMDFVAAYGTKVIATGDGIASEVSSSYGGYGNKIVVNHGWGYQTLYAHLSRFNVHPGQRIKRGQVIGFVGSTGLSTAPHLHYEVHKNGSIVNPINYYFNDLTPAQYSQMIQISARGGQTFD